MTELTKKFVSVISNTIQSMIEKELRWRITRPSICTKYGK